MATSALTEFLERYPWPEDWARRGSIQNYLYTYELNTTPDKLWPYLADVSAFNKLIGLSQMHFTEKDGKAFGWAKTPVGLLAWEELPWEWDYGRSIAHARLYYKGNFKVFRARYIIESLGENRLRLTVYFGLVSGNLLGKITGGIYLKSLKEKYRKAFATLIPYIQKQQKLILASRPVVFSTEVEKRLETIQKSLEEKGVPPALAKKVVEYVKNAPEEDLVRIRLKTLAREWNTGERELLEAFLLATRQGLFKLTWDVICPHCRGVREEVTSLGQLPKRGNCAVCKIDFDATSFNALEVTFHVHPSIRQVEKRLFCAAEPATKPHIKLQKTIKPQEELALPTLLGSGRYRLRLQAKEIYNLLDVDAQEKQNQVTWTDGLAQQNLKSAYFPTLVLKNTSPEAKTFILEENQLDKDTLRPVDLFSLQGFRDLYSQEALGSDVKLEIGVQTILFTDLVGSTRFYEVEGDTVAFTEVKEHFTKAYEVVKKYGGAVVKTIGDAVMAAFAHPVDAMKAAVELQEYFNSKNQETRLRLRVTLNTGSCLAVNLNSSIDYFGNTVNLAAKIQAIANAGQIGFTEIVLNDPEVKGLLEEKGLKPEKLDFEMKWAKRTIPAYRVEVK